ncbi:hypothetical protein HY411_00750, partial [Candidatus Gottesmanbacteria bacterium]|nr:hypothetical protein [Candidatus Gottesmanbacteria bacterium]
TMIPQGIFDGIKTVDAGDKTKAMRVDSFDEFQAGDAFFLNINTVGGHVGMILDVVDTPSGRALLVSEANKDHDGAVHTFFVLEQDVEEKLTQYGKIIVFRAYTPQELGLQGTALPQHPLTGRIWRIFHPEDRFALKNVEREQAPERVAASFDMMPPAYVASEKHVLPVRVASVTWEQLARWFSTFFSGKKSGTGGGAGADIGAFFDTNSAVFQSWTKGDPARGIPPHYDWQRKFERKIVEMLEGEKAISRTLTEDELDQRMDILRDWAKAFLQDFNQDVHWSSSVRDALRAFYREAASRGQQAFPAGQAECVTGDTLLSIVDGKGLTYRQVKDMKAGEYVLSLNEESGKLEPHKILGLLDKGVQEVYRLTTVDGRTIETTQNHPYLVRPKLLTKEDLARGFRSPVGELVGNDENKRSGNDIQRQHERAGTEELVEISSHTRDFFSSNTSPNAKLIIAGKRLDVNSGSQWSMETPYKPGEMRSTPIQPDARLIERSDSADAKLARENNFITATIYNHWTHVKHLSVGTEIAVANGDGITWVNIVSIVPTGKKPVYDIEVEGSHNFVGGHYVDTTTGKSVSEGEERLLALLLHDAIQVFREDKKGQKSSDQGQYQRDIGERNFHTTALLLDPDFFHKEMNKKNERDHQDSKNNLPADEGIINPLLEVNDTHSFDFFSNQNANPKNIVAQQSLTVNASKFGGAGKKTVKNHPADILVQNAESTRMWLEETLKENDIALTIEEGVNLVKKFFSGEVVYGGIVAHNTFVPGGAVPAALEARHMADDAFFSPFGSINVVLGFTKDTQLIQQYLDELEDYVSRVLPATTLLRQHQFISMTNLSNLSRTAQDLPPAFRRQYLEIIQRNADTIYQAHEQYVSYGHNNESAEETHQRITGMTSEEIASQRLKNWIQVAEYIQRLNARDRQITFDMLRDLHRIASYHLLPPHLLGFRYDTDTIASYPYLVPMKTQVQHTFGLRKNRPLKTLAPELLRPAMRLLLVRANKTLRRRIPRFLFELQVAGLAAEYAYLHPHT